MEAWTLVTGSWTFQHIILDSQLSRFDRAANANSWSGTLNCTTSYGYPQDLNSTKEQGIRSLMINRTPLVFGEFYCEYWLYSIIHVYRFLVKTNSSKMLAIMKIYGITYLILLFGITYTVYKFHKLIQNRHWEFQKVSIILIISNTKILALKMPRWSLSYEYINQK